MLRKMAATTKKFRIQYASDLHLEMYTEVPKFETLLKPVAPYLALAGDIGQPPQLKDLFAWIAPQWKRIFYLPGNHEYYGGNLEEREQELRQLVSLHENIHFLHPSSSYFCEEENVAVVGGTLWSEVPRNSRWRKCNDYRHIRTRTTVGDPGLAVLEKLNELHKEHRTLLEDQIEVWRNRGAEICAITHHLPSFRLIHPQFWGSDVNQCFASGADALLKPPVRLWIYGHSHTCSYHTIKGVLCVSNARGYKEERVPGWRADVWMEFPVRDPQELEAAQKIDQTPLRNPEEEVEFM
jgi:hypothetical protein